MTTTAEWLRESYALATSQCDESCGQEYAKPIKNCRHWQAIQSIQQQGLDLAQHVLRLMDALEESECTHWGEMHQIKHGHRGQVCADNIAWADGTTHPCKEPCLRCQALQALNQLGKEREG